MSFDPALRNMLIFLVDDEAINLKLLKTILNQAGFENVMQFISGEDMLSVLETTIPDVILLDIMMPGISGYEVLERVKSNPLQLNVPFIMITAASHEPEMEPMRKSFELGAVDYITKPFSSIELVMRIQSALKLERQRQALEAAADKIKSLEKLLPICSYCKKVRNDQNYWQDVEVYISAHTEAMFSHSICPGCYQLYVKPQIDELKSKS
ncbi:MAG: response regulator [Candidatus Cloacimonadaceae bacterium]|nr:response regulator [Candidatus Cloacimonadaceae bacterium]MDP3115226.1 response regulator [Candidatus Cloacimonadaceae bacterium]